MTALHRLWRALWPGHEHDAASQRRRDELAERVHMVETTTKRNVQQAQEVRRQLRGNPIAEDIFGATPPAERRRP